MIKYTYPIIFIFLFIVSSSYGQISGLSSSTKFEIRPVSEVTGESKSRSFRIPTTALVKNIPSRKEPTTTIPTEAPNAKPIVFKVDRTGQDYALFFAVNQYQSPQFQALKNPIQDAQAIAKELSESYGFQTEVITNPTAIQIEDKLAEYEILFKRQSEKQAGQLFIFFSGHGEFDKETGYFLPTDAQPNRLSRTAIDYPYLKKVINLMSCKHILLALDACYSGTFDEAIAMRGKPNSGRPGELSEQEKFYQNHLNRKTRKFLASGAKVQTPDKSDFAKKILIGLRNEAIKNNVLSVGKLFEVYIKIAIPTPVFKEFEDDEAGSSFLFFAK